MAKRKNLLISVVALGLAAIAVDRGTRRFHKGQQRPTKE